MSTQTMSATQLAQELGVTLATEEMPQLVAAINRIYQRGLQDAGAWHADAMAQAVVDERLACAELMATLRQQSRNHLFRSALTIAEGEIRARGAK